MVKRKILVEHYAHVKRMRESELERKFIERNLHKRVRTVKDIPMQIIKSVYTLITGKACNGVCKRSFALYRSVVWKWLNKVWSEGYDAAIDGPMSIRFLLGNVSQGVWKKLGIDVSKMKISESTISSSTLSASMEISNAGSSSSILSDDEVLFNRENVNDAVSEVDTMSSYDDYQVLPSTEVQARKRNDSDDSVNEDIPIHRRLSLREIFKQWSCSPRTLSLSQMAYTDLFRLIHKNRPAFDETELWNFPKTGKGLAYLPANCYDHVTFRDLNKYNAEKDIFVDENDLREPYEKWAFFDDNEMEEDNNNVNDGYDQEDDCNIDSQLSQSNNHFFESQYVNDSQLSQCYEVEERDDENIQSLVSQGGQSNSSSSDGDGDESNSDIACGDDETESSIRDNVSANYSDDVKKCIAKEELKVDQPLQEMCYFGIENVLRGINPGIFDMKGYENVLKVISVLDETALSDDFVDRLFPKTAEEDKPKKGNRGREPVFVIDLFVDGVAIFKNSRVASCTPIMGRVVSVDGYFIPCNRSKPFVIAIYHGEGKADLEPFLSDLCKELKFLHPDTKIRDYDYKRRLTIKVRAIIADAPERSRLRATKSCSGYYSCERCKIRGKFFTEDVQDRDNEGNTVEKTMRGLKFPDCDCEPRVDEEWESYLDLEGTERNPRMKHRNSTTPIEKIKGFSPINGFPLEEMHLVDGGMLRDTIKLLLNIKDSDSKWTSNRKKAKLKKGARFRRTVKSVAMEKLDGWNKRILKWRKQCTPYEFPRRCRNLEDFKLWKMSEVRQFFMYYMIPLMFSDRSFARDRMALVLRCIRGYSRITGNSYNPVPEASLRRSREELKEFFLGMRQINPKWCTYKCHAACCHLVDDAKYFGCHTTTLSAYPFESQVSYFGKCEVTGRYVVKQLTNKLMKSHFNRPKTEEDEEIFEGYLSKVRQNDNNLFFGPFFVHGFNSNKQIVTCESFKVTNAFPNNIVRIKKLFPNSGKPVPRFICVIESIYNDLADGVLKVRVRPFVNVKNSFIEPYYSCRIGSYFCSRGVEEESQIFNFSDIDAKFFPFPLKQLETFLPSDKKQHWIMQVIRHSSL